MMDKKKNIDGGKGSNVVLSSIARIKNRCTVQYQCGKRLCYF